MSTAVQKYTADTLTQEQFEELVQTMNVGVLTVAQRASFLFLYAKSLGLDPLTKPFDLIPGQSGKLIIYANRACSDQLRKIHNLTITKLSSGPLVVGDETRKDVWVTEVRVTNKEGRSEDHTGAVGISGLEGDALANAIMKCSTKASRRGTIAFCGLGMLDETEVSAIAPAPAATFTPSDPTTVEVITPKLLPNKPLPAAKPPIKI